MAIVMEKFKASNPRIEVNGETILAFVGGSQQRKNILEKYGISPVPGSWYSQQKWLDAFKDVAQKVGPVTLKLIGKVIPENAKFPPQIKTLKDAFSSLDTAYKMNHRGGEIGYYKLVSYNEQKREIIMEINTPYPEEFDEGILIGLFDKFKSKDIGKIPSIKKTR